VRGWTLPEIALLYGMVNMSFAASEAAARGFDVFAERVKGGTFDRLLLRPRSTAFQVAAETLQLMRIGRFGQGLVILIWATATLDVGWTPARIALLVAALVGGFCLFYGLFVFQATLCFFTTESLEIMNTVTYGGVETAQFPLSIYRGWFRTFFTFVIPLACVNYLPALAILGRSDPLGAPDFARWLAPIAGPLFLGASLVVWGFGVRRYRSTGS